jgi:ABC-type lipoprotein export system ATPase subunit
MLLCDEPTGNLDSKNSDVVTSILHELAKEFSATLIIVTHNEDVAKTFSDSDRLVMKDGSFL